MEMFWIFRKYTMKYLRVKEYSVQLTLTHCRKKLCKGVWREENEKEKKTNVNKVLILGNSG